MLLYILAVFIRRAILEEHEHRDCDGYSLCDLFLVFLDISYALSVSDNIQATTMGVSTLQDPAKR